MSTNYASPAIRLRLVLLQVISLRKINFATYLSTGITKVDNAGDGRLSNDLMLEHWAFAAEFPATTTSTQISTLFRQALNALLNWKSTIRSMEQQLLDTLALEVASSKEKRYLDIVLELAQGGVAGKTLQCP